MSLRNALLGKGIHRLQRNIPRRELPNVIAPFLLSPSSFKRASRRTHMRVKSLAAAAGIAALTAVVAVPGISNASRLNTRTEPQVQTDTTPTTEPVVETPTQPSETTTTTTAPAVEAPTTTTTTTTEPAPAKPPAPAPPPAPVTVTPAPAGEPPLAADTPAPPVDVAPTPAPAPQPDSTDHGRPADPCHMDDYHSVQVDSLDSPGEAARAHKIDRNGNGTVCRKDIPGRGHGNTGEGSNIKDDQAA